MVPLLIDNENILDSMVMVGSQSATIYEPWRCDAPSSWLGNREERAKCLEKLQQGLQAATRLAAASRDRKPALLVLVVSSTIEELCMDYLRNPMGFVRSACERGASCRRTCMTWCLWEARPESQRYNP